MSSVQQRYQKWSRRRYLHAARGHTRLDIQGLRMVAVLTVFACHLWKWPSGGFVGVDVFFVISGFLITGNLLRDAEKRGTVSFRTFYWNRVRRIVPAATVVLILTCVAAYLIFAPFRAREVGVDALFAFVFASNWWFGYNGTDYFRVAADSVSPLQHYWSLSIEEQFYMVWPALIALISVFVLRKAWTHGHRMRIAGYVMAVVVVASLAWALYETVTSPAWAYFNTFARVWELGVGAVLACSVGLLARIPQVVKPWLSWLGLVLIAASLFLITDVSTGFPAPWAILPIAGAALVIAAGVGGEPAYQQFLRNPLSTYIGDISYSLYLVHWPIIIFAALLMDVSGAYYLLVVALAFALAIASYHFVENPLRRADAAKFRSSVRDIRHGRFTPSRAARHGGIAAAALLVVALSAFALHPDANRHAQPPAIASGPTATPGGPAAPPLGPLATALGVQITAALQSTAWPPLDPPMEDVLKGSSVDPAIQPCDTDNPTVDTATCTFGSPTAPTRIVLAGDSEGNSYAGALRNIVLASDGRLQLLVMSMQSCSFTKEVINRATLSENCEARKQHVVDTINTTKPDIVIIANLYRFGKNVDNRQFKSGERDRSMRAILDEFKASTGKVVFLSGPPGGVNIKDCFGKRSSTPADCLGTVTQEWLQMASVDRNIASDIGGAWIDARPWFCVQLCPSFVDTTATKSDEFHMAPAYGQKIAPVIDESLRAAGVY